MKLIDGFQQTGRPFHIPDCSRDELPEFCRQQGYKMGAEIGVYKGAFTKLFLDDGLFMYAIDPWRAYQGAGRTQQRQERQDFLYGHVCRTLGPHEANGRCYILRLDSAEALTRIPDDWLDFVYLDGDHSFASAAHDVYWWSRKVRSGGLVAGHDYFDTSPAATNVVCHVKSVVDAYTGCFGIDRWWTFGGSDETRDGKTLSWMWVKP